MAALPRPSQVLLFSYPRTACHLLERMLSMQPKMSYLWHPFAPARPSQTQMFSQEFGEVALLDEARVNYLAKIQEGVEAWQKALSMAEAADETIFMHEHPHFAFDPDRALSFVTLSQLSGLDASGRSPENWTKIPDSLLLHPGTVPIFTIRHPALTFPAGYEAMKNLEKSFTRPNVFLVSSLAWHRELYDWYLSNGITPIVAEADDYMSSKEYVQRLAAKAGLSPKDCIFQWEKVSEDEQSKMNEMYVKLQQTLINSEGIVEGKAKREVDLEKEWERWENMHGVEEAAFLKDLVERSIADYEYLKGKKFKIET